MQEKNGHVYFVGAGPGAPDLITLRGLNLLKKADVVLYTGSLVPEEILSHVPSTARVRSSQDMSYEEIFAFIKDHCKTGTFVRLHTGDPSLYSTTAAQIQFLKNEQISWEVVPGVTAAFAGAASLGLEFTIPGVSQTVVLTRMEGNTPNPEMAENLFRLKNSSLVFYLSARLVDRLVSEAKKAGWNPQTPCLVAERISWPEERTIRGTLEDIAGKVKDLNIKGAALIYLGDFIHQEGETDSHLYSPRYASEGRYEPASPENRRKPEDGNR